MDDGLHRNVGDDKYLDNPQTFSEDLGSILAESCLTIFFGSSDLSFLFIKWEEIKIQLLISYDEEHLEYQI